MAHYGCKSHRTNARCANENGDVESLNGKIKDRIDQALRIRCSRDFASVEHYVAFLDHIVEHANRNRKTKFHDDQAALASLPPGARTVFVLHDIEGYRHAEIAEMIGLAEGTSKAQLFRARRLLREKLR